MASHSSSDAGAALVSATGRRRFAPEFKRHLVALTLHPGASVAGIARAHQLNANQLFKWRREYVLSRLEAVNRAFIQRDGSKLLYQLPVKIFSMLVVSQSKKT